MFQRLTVGSGAAAWERQNKICVFDANSTEPKQGLTAATDKISVRVSYPLNFLELA